MKKQIYLLPLNCCYIEFVSKKNLDTHCSSFERGSLRKPGQHYLLTARWTLPRLVRLRTDRLQLPNHPNHLTRPSIFSSSCIFRSYIEESRLLGLFSELCGAESCSGIHWTALTKGFDRLLHSQRTPDHVLYFQSVLHHDSRVRRGKPLCHISLHTGASPSHHHPPPARVLWQRANQPPIRRGGISKVHRYGLNTTWYNRYWKFSLTLITFWQATQEH